MSALSTRFTEAYGARHPIACAGMAFVGMNSELAVAVARGGGVGAIGVGLTPPPAVREMASAFRAQAAGPLHLNFITCFTDEGYIELCEALRPEIVSFHWGHPPKAWIDRLHAAGAKVWEQVGSASSAASAIEDGVDLLVVQGQEAGGHNLAELPLFAAVPEVRRTVGPEPLLLAAGGVSDGATLAAALALGADGAWVGTRLVASREADAHPGYKAALVEARSSDTRLTSMFGRAMPQFNPMRVLSNRVVDEWHERQAEMPPEDDQLPVIGRVRLGEEETLLRRFTNFVPMERTQGDIEEMPLLAGQGVGAIQSVEPVATILETMSRDAGAQLQRLAAGLAR
jgi:enoyl-[acyl-carrier protein] reductase II